LDRPAAVSRLNNDWMKCRGTREFEILLPPVLDTILLAILAIGTNGATSSESLHATVIANNRGSVLHKLTCKNHPIPPQRKKSSQKRRQSSEIRWARSPERYNRCALLRAMFVKARCTRNNPSRTLSADSQTSGACPSADGANIELAETNMRLNP
jgi:hypothetical protein